MSVAPILIRALRYGGLVAAAIAAVAAVIGFLVAGPPGLLGALLGAGLSAVFLGITAVSILLAARLTGGDLTNPAFIGIVLGAWFAKLVVFLVIGIWLRTQTWLDPLVFFVTVILAVIGSLIADVLAFQRSRVPYVSDVALPGERPRS